MTTYPQVTKEIEKLEQFLSDRGWETGTLAGIVERANVEIERVQDRARTALVWQLNRYLEEAQNWAANEATTLSGEHVPISKREQQKSATDARRIGRAIETIENTKEK